MNEQSKQLRDLEAQLHEVNQAFAAAARPLDRLSEMSLEEREQVATRLREVQARWEVLTQQISPLIQTSGRVLFEQMRAEDRSL